MPRCVKYSPSGSIGRRNLPCSTVKAQTENSTGARFASSNSASSSVRESLPPDSATATRSPSRIILKRWTASPTFRSSVFSISTTLIIAADFRMSDFGGVAIAPRNPFFSLIPIRIQVFGRDVVLRYFRGNHFSYVGIGRVFDAAGHLSLEELAFFHQLLHTL